ncbi:MAG TPA: hypothetical protein VGO47_04030, partial [Chlamydiales bacterium]|nr:hypothetical protein [Chlamydiales bacterium]
TANYATKPKETMKPIIRPQPEDTRTPYQRFEDLAKQVFAVPKDEIDTRQTEYEKERKKKRRKSHK